MPVALRCEGVRFSARALKADATRLLALLGRPRAELSVLLCDDAFIAELNRQYRQKEGPTDVLSFAMDDERVLGDVVISLDTARRQAEAIGHALDDELRVLLVHGCLHLLGHDHEAPGDDARMAAEESRCLVGLGLSAPSLVSRAL
ncbi:MAG: rRNA maturation RNase YbeY [Deltaproteobacteria bacterium]|nr:rRNA maturation RNase YbeY [Deltaproteobacteria bacterium]